MAALPRCSGSCMPTARPACDRATPARRVQLEPVLGALAAVDRPLRLFTSKLSALRWIDSHANGGLGGGAGST